MDEPERRAMRRERRRFIREHHPDRGGDPDDFIVGLNRFSAEYDLRAWPLPRVVVVRHRPWPVRLADAVARQIWPVAKPPRVR
jgi:hypothetical protein